MSTRRRLLTLLRNARIAPAGRVAAVPCTRRLHLPSAAAAANTSGSSDGDFNCSRNRQWGATFGAVLIGQAAVFLGLSNNSVLAQDDSVGPAAARTEATGGSVASLHRIEDGSIISNEHTAKWRIFTDNAREFFLKGKIDEAEKFFKAALHEAKEGFGLKDPHVASALNNLAEVYSFRKEYEKAEPLFLEAVEILEESFGPDDIRFGKVLRNLGIYYHGQKKLDQAQTCYERALKIEGHVLGLGHPNYANTLFLLAKVLSLQRKGKDAEDLMRESIRILEEAGLGGSLACTLIMRALSSELTKANRLAEAEIFQMKILHNLEVSKGWDSLDTTMAAEALGFTLQNIGKLKESEELLERCLAARKRILSEDHLKVACTSVHLARLSVIKSISDIKMNNGLARSQHIKAKQLLNDSIRISEGVLDHKREDEKKLNNTPAAAIDQITATAVLLQAIEVVGLLEIAKKAMLEPGLVVLLRLPLAYMKHGYIKIDAVRISDTCQLFVWPDKHLTDVRYTTLRIHFKNIFEKDQFDEPIKQALSRCISLYNEPHTRSIVSKPARQAYVSCLSGLIRIIRDYPGLFNTMKMQDLLAKSQEILKELGEENSSSK